MATLVTGQTQQPRSPVMAAKGASTVSLGGGYCFYSDAPEPVTTACLVDGGSARWLNKITTIAPTYYNTMNLDTLSPTDSTNGIAYKICGSSAYPGIFGTSDIPTVTDAAPAGNNSTGLLDGGYGQQYARSISSWLFRQFLKHLLLLEQDFFKTKFTYLESRSQSQWGATLFWCRFLRGVGK